MKKNTEIIKIPSFHFSTQFITELKNIVEDERNVIIQKFQTQLKKEKNDLKKIVLENEINDYSISYSLKYKDEITNATSIDELFQLIAPRTEFDNFTGRIHSYRDKSFLDIHLRINKNFPDNSELELSSDEKDKIIVAKDKFKRLFKNHKTSYSFYYLLPFTFRFTLSAILILIFSLFIMAGIDKIHHISRDLITLTFYMISILTFIIYYNVISRYFIPYIKFKDISKVGLASFLIGGLIIIFWSFIYDLFKRSIGF
jgi:hypothetical protein